MLMFIVDALISQLYTPDLIIKTNPVLRTCFLESMTHGKKTQRTNIKQITH